ncbi:MAG: hypothetical protein IT167_03535 [Bryobacterales bacterium]|nr:hypothetical protein [Bryobacterales bacterium]
MKTMPAKQIHPTEEISASVYCPICTHIVAAVVTAGRKGSVVKPGQKCGHCHASIDAGYVLPWKNAA